MNPAAPVIGSLADLSGILGARRALFVTDDTVRSAWPEPFDGRPVVVLGQGEDNKNLESLTKIYDAAVAAGLTRADVIVGIGGGCVCDMAAMAASTWMRGCRLVLVPTTLLAQVDAAIGGKTAINHAGFKNLVGTFYPAHTVLIAPQLLSTLPRELLVEGYAELLKHAIIADRGLFWALRDETRAGITAEMTSRWLERALAIKARIVAADPTERGERMLLNFGHTLGHAVEATTGLRHGLSVALGMTAATRVSQQRGMLTPDEADQVIEALSSAGLPVRWDDTAVHAPRAALLQAMGFDKKRRATTANVVVLERVGRARVLACDTSIYEELVGALA